MKLSDNSLKPCSGDKCWKERMMQEIEEDLSFEYTDDDCYYDPYYFDEYGSCVCDHSDGDF